jgi:GH25 family lysozyme M1 (1,4-beta-N-acetylmuramidase)
MRRFSYWILAAAVAHLFVASAHAAVNVKGIDVSNHQGTISWGPVAGAGYTFTAMKATEGTGFTDAYFASNVTNARAAGLDVSPYHFCRLDNGDADPTQDAINEANYFLSRIKPYYQNGKLLPPMADMETWPTGLTTAQYNTLTSTWLLSFSNTIYNALGVHPIVYTSQSKANSYFSGRGLTNLPLWDANWKGTGTANPPTAADTPAWGQWTFWQWSDNQDTIAQNDPVPGIAGGFVDRDVYFGTQAQLDAMLVGYDGAIPGDFNRDNMVDMADYILWRSKNGQTVPIYSGADGNGDAKVDINDYNVWRSHYGNSQRPPSGAVSLSGEAVPEPGSILLALIALFHWAVFRGVRHQP